MTGHLLYTEEDVELVRSFIGGCSQCYDDDEHTRTAREILTALSSANRLVPPGSEVREEWGVHILGGDHVIEFNQRELATAELAFRRERGFVAPSVLVHREHRLFVDGSKLITAWSPSVPDTEEGT